MDYATVRKPFSLRQFLNISLKVFVLLAIFSSLFIRAEDVYASTSVEPYSVLVVAGQSNAQGNNSFHFHMNPPLGSHPADSATKIMWSTGDNQLSVERFSSSTSQLVPLTSIQPSGYFGPEVGLARNLWDQGRRNMVILKVTYGLQRLIETPNNTFGGHADWNPNSVGESYDQLKLKKSQLENIMQANGDKYTMDGFYWVQGESDAVKGTSTSSYQSNLSLLLNSVKQDLGMHPESINVLGKISGQFCLTNVYNLIYNPEGCGVVLCVIHVHPCSSEAMLAEGNANVRQAIQNVADSDPKTFVVETEDLERVSDFVHMNAAAQLTLGKRMSNSNFELPYRLEGSNDYDGDGILNEDEDANGNANLGDDDFDLDLIPDYLDDLIGPGGGREAGVQAARQVEDDLTGNENLTQQNSTLNWKFSVSNNASTPSYVEIEDEISSRQSYVPGSLITPPNYQKSYSTDGGNNFVQDEPVSGVTNVKATKSDVPVGAKGDSSEIESQATSYTNSTSDNHGYVPIIVGSRIFTLFNNTTAGTGPGAGKYDIGCVEKTSGTNCPGYPKDFTDASGNTDFISPFVPIHYLDEETGRIFITTQRNTGYGVVCFDTSADAMCSNQQYTQLSSAGTPLGGERKSRIAQISKIGSCLFTYDIDLKVYSYDPATGATPCAGKTTKNLVSAYGTGITAYNISQHSDYGGTGPITQSEVVGSKLYFTMNYAFQSNLDIFGCNFLVEICKGTRIVCFDSESSDGRCSNGAGGYFTNPLVTCYADRFCKLQQLFVNPTNNAVCAFSIKEPGYTLLGTFCRDTLTGGIVSVSTELGSVGSKGWEAADMANYLPMFEEVKFTMPNGHVATIFPWQKGYLIASPRSGKAVCFDWTANALCADFGFEGEGASRWDTWTYNGVTSAQVGSNGDTNDIGYTADSAGCIWAKGKSGDIWSFDSQNGSSPCRRYDGAVSVVPSQFYCEVIQGTIGGWDKAKLQFPIGTSTDDLVELYATVLDANGSPIVGYENVDLLNLSANVTILGELDIDDISIVDHPSLSVNIRFKAVNSSIFSSVNANPLVVLTFSGDDPQVCYQTQVEDACNITTPLTNSGVVRLTDENLETRQVELTSTTIVQYEDGESCVPDIKVSTSAPPGKLFPGETVTYSILVENVANTDPLSEAVNVNLTNTIPEGSIYLSSSGGSLTGRTVSWPTFSLAGSSSRSFDVTLTIGSSSQSSLLNIVNAQLVNDPTSSNNSFISSNEIGVLSIIGAKAWNDLNRDGIVDDAEPSLAGVQVQIYQAGILVNSLYTDTDGQVDFINLMPGTGYTVRYVKPNNYEVSPKDAGGDDSLDSDIDNQTYSSEPMSLNEGEYKNTTYAGFYSVQSDPDPNESTTTTTTQPPVTTTTTPTTTTTQPEQEIEPDNLTSVTTPEIESSNEVGDQVESAVGKSGGTAVGNSGAIRETATPETPSENKDEQSVTVRLPIFGGISVTASQADYTTAGSVATIFFGFTFREFWKRRTLKKHAKSSSLVIPRKYKF